jgi:hypothetical protein
MAYQPSEQRTGHAAAGIRLDIRTLVLLRKISMKPNITSCCFGFSFFFFTHPHPNFIYNFPIF